MIDSFTRTMHSVLGNLEAVGRQFKTHRCRANCILYAVNALALCQGYVKSLIVFQGMVVLLLYPLVFCTEFTFSFLLLSHKYVVMRLAFAGTREIKNLTCNLEARVIRNKH